MNVYADFASLPATRRARAEALVEMLEREPDHALEFSVLRARLVSPAGAGWTAAQLDKAVDDCADEAVVDVTSDGGGNLRVRVIGGGI